MSRLIFLLFALASPVISAAPGQGDGAPDVVAPAEAVPAFLKGLSYTGPETKRWFIRFGIEDNGSWSPKLVDGNGNRIVAPGNGPVQPLQRLMPGDLFPGAGDMAKRFKFIRFGNRVIFNPQLNINQNVRIAFVEDQSEAKLGKVYEVKQGISKAQRIKDTEEDLYAAFKWKGPDGKVSEFLVMEGATFAFPPNKDEKKVRVLAAKKNSVTIGMGEGEKARKVTLKR